MKGAVIFVCLCFAVGSEAFLGLGDNMGGLALINSMQGRPLFDMSMFGFPSYGGVQPQYTGAAAMPATTQQRTQQTQQRMMMPARRGTGLGMLGPLLLFDGFGFN